MDARAGIAETGDTEIVLCVVLFIIRLLRAALEKTPDPRKVA
jgi:hypothetical protein